MKSFLKWGRGLSSRERKIGKNDKVLDMYIVPICYDWRYMKVEL